MRLCSGHLWHVPGSGSHWHERFFVTMSLSSLIYYPFWNVSVVVWLNTLGNNSFFYSMISDDDKLRSHFPLEKWHHVTSAFTLLPYFCVFFHSVIGFGRTVTRNPKTLGYIYFLKACLLIFFKDLSFPKAGYTWSCLGIFFAATALPPNGIDQRLLHCSLPLCLCSEYAHCYATNLDRVRNRCPTPWQTAPPVSLPWYCCQECKRVQRQRGQSCIRHQVLR